MCDIPTYVVCLFGIDGGSQKFCGVELSRARLFLAGIGGIANGFDHSVHLLSVRPAARFGPECHRADGFLSPRRIPI